LIVDFTAYHPIVIEEASLPEPRDAHHVDQVPWIACEKAYCQSTSLQMIAEWRSGDRLSVDFINWLMGFTYGAGHLKGSFLFLPYDDPEAGLRFAAGFLGLKHRYFVSDDESTYVKAIKASLTSGLPVRIMLDSATLKGRDDYFSPHSIVLVGYRGDTALMYETRTKDKREEHAVGQPVPWTTITTAARKVSEIYRYPWVFQFTHFEPTPSVPVVAAEICARNARLLLGQNLPYVATGAFALRSLAADLGRDQGPQPRWEDLKIFLEYGAYTRADNARYLDETLVENGPPGLDAVAACLTKAGRCYAAMVDLLTGDGEVARPKLIDELGRAAALEEQAGRLLEKCGQRLGM
jgi:hypothetical protein